MGSRRNDETGVTTYQWFDGDEVGEGFKRVTEFYVEGYIDGKLVGLTLNPDGPRSFFRSLVAGYFAPFFASLEDYWEKGYKTGPTKAQLRDRLRCIGGIDMMPNQAFEVGLFTAGFPVAKTAPSGVSLEGSAYELKFLDRHLMGAAAEREIARGSAHVFKDLATLSRVESEIFARGTETGSS